MKRKLLTREKFEVMLCAAVKAIPVQAWRGPEIYRWLRLPDFNTLRTGEANLRFYITTAQDG